MADSIEVRLRPALCHREGELTRCRSPGGSLFVITEALFVIRIHVFYRILPVFYPYSTHFPKLTVFYRIHQERTRIHKNTSMWKSVSAIFIESARIPQNTARIPHRVRIL